MSDPKPCCDGIEVINAKLAEFNATLVINLFGNPKTTIATCKLRESVRAKKAPHVFASFCPFCGVRYASEGQAAGPPSTAGASTPPLEGEQSRRGDSEHTRRWTGQGGL